MSDAIIISDIHLGSDICQAKLLEQFLSDIHHNVIHTTELILNGDVFENWDFRRLKKNHWRVLSQIRKMSDHVNVVWVGGNHDGPTELVSHLLGVTVVDEYIIESGEKKILLVHGHQFDKFMDDHPFLTWFGDIIYNCLQKMDPSFYLAKTAKHSSKHFLRCVELVEEKAKKYAEKNGYDTVCCGHTHFAIEKPGEISYYNSGCWTELPCTYLTIENGIIELHNLTHKEDENGNIHNLQTSIS